MRTSFVPASLTLLVLAACGGSEPEAKTPAPATSASSSVAVAPSSTPEGTKPAEDPKATEQKALREQFVQSCTKALPAPEYCDCSWGEFQKTFSGNEELDPSKMKDFQVAVRKACGAKLPEDVVKNSFAQSCEGKSGKELKGYCGCAWTELKKRIDIADFAGALDDEKGKTAKREMIKACGKQFPESVAKKEFDSGCANTPEQKPFCECAWKIIRGSASAAEIAANLVDMESVKPKLQASCGKLRK